MGNKLKIEALLSKIAQVRLFSIFAILSIIFSAIIIWSLNINIVFMGFFVYLFSLYVVCFFLTNEIIDKYKDTRGEFYMSKEVFISFFKKSYILKTILLSLLPITLFIWGYITFDIILINLRINILSIVGTLLILIYFCYSIKKLIDSFVIVVFMTRIIEHICINEKDIICDK